MLPRFMARRCARGYNAITQASGHNLHLILYNNSTGAQLIIVRDLQINSETGTQINSALVQGSVGANATNPVNIVAGEALPPGQVLTLESTTLPTADYLLATDSNFNVPWVHDFPFTVLLPGWSLQCFAIGSGASVLRGSFFFQWCYAQELDDLYEM